MPGLLFHDPVVLLGDGVTYERAAIEARLAGDLKASPTQGTPLDLPEVNGLGLGRFTLAPFLWPCMLLLCLRGSS